MTVITGHRPTQSQNTRIDRPPPRADRSRQDPRDKPGRTWRHPLLRGCRASTDDSAMRSRSRPFQRQNRRDLKRLGLVRFENDYRCGQDSASGCRSRAVALFKQTAGLGGAGLPPDGGRTTDVHDRGRAEKRGDNDLKGHNEKGANGIELQLLPIKPPGNADRFTVSFRDSSPHAALS